MRIAVAGGSGFIGRHVVAALLDAGHEVRVLSRRPPERGEHVACDLTAGPVPAHALAGCDGIVNLVGIKAGSDADFEAAHVGVVKALASAAKESGIRRFVHVSVVDVPGSTTIYTRTKRAGETIVRESPHLHATILRPALVVGPGDDALSQSVAMVRLAPIFPVPRPAPGRLAIVDVRDVAAAVVAALARGDVAAATTYDVVGPERLTMRQLVQRVARSLRLPTWSPVVPAALMRPAAAVLERMGPLAIITRSQLDMLVRGLDGDGAAAARDLDLHPRALDDARIAEVSRAIRAPSLRLCPDAAHAAWLAAARPIASSLAWFLPLALLAMIGLPSLWPDVWSRMAVVQGGLALLAVAFLPLPWRALARPSPRSFAVGLLAAAVMIAPGMLGFLAMRPVLPGLAAGVPVVVAWTEAISPIVGLPLVTWVVAAEDVVWRAAIGLPLCARIGPVAGCIAGGAVFAIAHVTTGPPILWLAALLAGTAWTALLVRTRSLLAVVVCHLAWDLGMIGVLRGIGLG